MADRLIRGRLESAARCAPRFGKPLSKNLTPHQAAGIAYERKVHKALGVLVASIGARCEYQPWFTFIDTNGPGACAVDFLIHDESGRTLVVECKLTDVPAAPEKLRRLYMPIVARVLSLDSKNIRAVIICKNLASTSINIRSDLSAAFDTPFAIPTIQWLGHGPLSW